MNPKNNYSPALQEDARRFEVLVIFPVSARQFGIKDMLVLELKTFWGESYDGWLSPEYL